MKYFRFSIRSTLLLMTIGVFVAAYTKQRVQIASIVKQVEALGGTVEYHPSTAHSLGIDFFADVKTLDLSGTRVDDELLSKLTSMRALKDLDLSETNLPDTAFLPLKNIRNLRSLKLNGCRNAGSNAFSALRKMEQLRLLQIQKTKIRNCHIRNLGAMANLKELSFCGKVDAQDLVTLEKFDVVKPEGAIYLSGMLTNDLDRFLQYDLSGVQHLYLEDCELTSQSMKHLDAFSFEFLKFKNCDLDAGAILAFSWKNAKKCSIEQSDFPFDALCKKVGGQYYNLTLQVAKKTNSKLAPKKSSEGEGLLQVNAKIGVPTVLLFKKHFDGRFAKHLRQHFTLRTDLDLFSKIQPELAKSKKEFKLRLAINQPVTDRFWKMFQETPFISELRIEWKWGFSPKLLPPASFSSHQKLRHLDIALPCRSEQQLLDEIPKLTQLERLDIRNTGKIGKEISSLARLQKLKRIEASQLTPDAIVELKKMGFKIFQKHRYWGSNASRWTVAK